MLQWTCSLCDSRLSFLLTNIQPFLYNFTTDEQFGLVIINLTNALSLKKELEDQGAIFFNVLQVSDTEILMHFEFAVAHHNPALSVRVKALVLSKWLAPFDDGPD